MCYHNDIKYSSSTYIRKPEIDYRMPVYFGLYSGRMFRWQYSEWEQSEIIDSGLFFQPKTHLDRVMIGVSEV